MQLRGNGFRLRQHKGFTLVEMMIVTGIISLLAALAVPQFAQARTNAQTQSCINNLRQIQSAKEQYSLFVSIPETTVITDGTDLDSFLRGGYDAIECPANGAYTVGAINADVVCSVAGHILS